MNKEPTRSCIECDYGEPIGRLRDKCNCLWPMEALGQDKPDEILNPSEGACDKFAVKKNQESEFLD